MQVLGEGALSSKLWILGECPGSNEERLGRPFVGGSGIILDGILHDVGISRADCYVDNVIQSRPKSNDFGVFYKDKSKRVPTAELLSAHDRINDLIKTHRPNVVVALGNESLYALTGQKGITKLRGSILGCHGVKVIPSLHPAMVMRQYEFRPVSVLDFHRIKAQAKFPEFSRSYTDNLIINPTFTMVMSYLEMLKTKEYVSFDIETNRAEQIRCLGLGWSKQDAICIPICYGETSYWTSEQELAIVQRVRELFACTEPKLIAQNAQYDMTYLKDKWGVVVKNLWLDTMIAFHCIYPELRKGLDFLCSIYTLRPYYKDSGHGGPNQLWKYNCLDCVATWECAMEINRELKEFGTHDFYRTYSHPLIMPFMEMQRRGVRIDMTKRAEVDTNLTKDIALMEKKLVASIGHELSPNSPKQMKEFLYVELNLPKQYTMGTKNNVRTKVVTTNEEALESLNKKFPNPVFDLIIDIRKAKKLLSTYIKAPIEGDGRIRCSYVITGTVTGRISSRESIYGYGTNLQNIPRGDLVRSIFIPDPGKMFVNADLSQAEARVVAYVSGETRLQAVFSNSTGDVHTRNAALIFKKRIEDITSSERDLGKKLVHAANYGIGARTFGTHIGKSQVEAQQLLNQYYAMYPCIKLWHREVAERLRKSRTLRTPLGRRRNFFGRWSPELLRQAINYVPQATVGDLLNYGLIRAWNALPQDWEILMQVHDSVLMQVPIETDPMHLFKFITHFFEGHLDIGREHVVIPIDIKIGPSWDRLKKMEVIK